MVFTPLLMSLSTRMFLVDDMHLPSRVTHTCAHRAVALCVSLPGAAAALPVESVGDRAARSAFQFCLPLRSAARSALVREWLCFGMFRDRSDSIFILVISH